VVLIMFGRRLLWFMFGFILIGEVISSVVLFLVTLIMWFSAVLVSL